MVWVIRNSENMGTTQICNPHRLTSLTTTRANASVYLENQMEKVDVFVSGFEDQLAEELPLLDKPSALRERREELQVRIHISSCTRRRDPPQLKASSLALASNPLKIL